jgi:hypothetical protein
MAGNFFWIAIVVVIVGIAILAGIFEFLRDCVVAVGDWTSGGCPIFTARNVKIALGLAMVATCSLEKLRPLPQRCDPPGPSPYHLGEGGARHGMITDHGDLHTIGQVVLLTGHAQAWEEQKMNTGNVYLHSTATGPLPPHGRQAKI